MRDPDFARFLKRFYAATQTALPTEACPSKWARKLTPLLLKIWREEGCAGYGNARCRQVKPAGNEPIKDALLPEWQPPTINTFHVIAITALGNLQGEMTGPSALVVCILNTILAQNRRPKPKTHQDHRIRTLPSLGDPEGYHYFESEGKHLFDRALKRYARPCRKIYGFDPAIVLGRSHSLGHLGDLKLSPHLIPLHKPLLLPWAQAAMLAALQRPLSSRRATKIEMALGSDQLRRLGTGPVWRSSSAGVSLMDHCTAQRLFREFPGLLRPF